MGCQTQTSERTLTSWLDSLAKIILLTIASLNRCSSEVDSMPEVNNFISLQLHICTDQTSCQHSGENLWLTSALDTVPLSMVIRTMKQTCIYVVEWALNIEKMCKW